MGFAGKASTSCAFIVFPGRADGKACQWIFDYRSEAAQRYFQQMVAEVHACKGAVALPKDQPVNHPDSYELISYQLGNEVLTVSLKDKAALDQTFVFLRVEPLP